MNDLKRRPSIWRRLCPASSCVGCARGHALRIGVALMLIIVGNQAFAQSFTPPPGFAPEQDDDSPSASPSPSPSRIDSGHDDGVNPYRDSDSIYGPGTAESSKSSVLPRRIRTFRTPPDTVVITDAEPAMPRFWFRGEALYWWSKGSPLPVPLVTAGNPSDAVPGALGQPGTSVIMGNQNMSLPGAGGGRFTLGWTFDREQKTGIEGTYFFLSNVSSTLGVYANGSPGSALLSVPYYDPTGPGESASSISSPGNYAGYASTTVQSVLQGVDLNLLHNSLNSDGVRVDFLGGFRYVNLQEDLSFQTQSPTYGDPYSFYNTFDEFTTNNNFYGGQIGVRASYDPNRFFFFMRRPNWRWETCSSTSQSTAERLRTWVVVFRQRMAAI
jgi:hypothetical protein